MTTHAMRGGRSTYIVNYRCWVLALVMPLLPTGSDVIRWQDFSFKLDDKGSHLIGV